MANLSKALFKDKLSVGVDTAGFNDLDKLITRLEDATEKMPESLEKATREDALAISREMSNNFSSFIASLPRWEKTDLPVFTTYITNIRGGYNIAIEGTDIRYYEYGTGDQGINSNYPPIFDIKSGKYVYNAGPKVIHAGTSLSEAPQWYVGMVTKHPEKAAGNWWMSPHGPSNGIPAGKFFYYAVKDFRDGLTSDKEAMKWSLGRKSIHIKIRNGLLKGKWQ